MSNSDPINVVVVNCHAADAPIRPSVPQAPLAAAARQAGNLAWTSGIVRAIDRVNFLGDPSQTPHLKMTDFDQGVRRLQPAQTHPGPSPPESTPVSSPEGTRHQGCGAAGTPDDREAYQAHLHHLKEVRFRCQARGDGGTAYSDDKPSTLAETMAARRMAWRSGLRSRGEAARPRHFGKPTKVAKLERRARIVFSCMV